ncbi:MAG: aldehyde dehydrogenase family protein [Epsilonproteobacteria bacterium]|nr:aldehyde dehydrogenase family protein [Campylobacterota bacterium]
METFKTITPIDNSVYVEMPYHDKKDIQECLEKATKAQKEWQETPLKTRKEYIKNFIEALGGKSEEIAKELAYQMGRPIAYGALEIRGFKERANYMLDIVDDALKPFYPEPKKGFERYIVKEPLGVVAVLSPWNYPFLTSVNVIVPALLAGNSVILRHSTQTPLVAKRYEEAFKEVGLPEGVFSILYLKHSDASNFMADKRVKGVYFTGSVKGGYEVQKAILNKFIPCGLELGGKDPAYVREDADINFSAENLVDGSFFNSGQSCCGIERIYVHEKVYDEFVDRFVAITKEYKLGNPLEKSTTIGPMVKTQAADFVRDQIKEALQKGAIALTEESMFENSKEHTPYLGPTVLVDVDHSMSVMRDESFGPVVGIMKVKDDEEALRLMNDSDYGLTASIWTKDKEKARELSSKIETGTVYMNRCDYLDPALAWTGVKDTGRGVTLSKYGYDHVTRVKSIHFKEI